MILKMPLYFNVASASETFQSYNIKIFSYCLFRKNGHKKMPIFAEN